MDSSDLIHFKSPVPDKCDDPINPFTPGQNPFDVFYKRANDFDYFDNSFIFQMPMDTGSVEIGRESIPFIVPSPFAGRESLGLLKCNQMLISINSPMHLNSCSQNNTYTINPHSRIDNSSAKERGSDECGPNLNMALLLPSTVSTSSLSSYNSVGLSFHSNSLDEPSKIYSVQSSSQSCSNEQEKLLNEGFIASSLSTSDVIVSKGVDQNDKQDFRSRIHTSPVDIESSKNANYIYLGKKQNELTFWSPRSSKRPLTKRSTLELSIDEKEEDEEFDDSVFIEANHLAFRLSNGSIFENDAYEGEMLDDTNPPEFFDEEDPEDNNRNVKCDAETVFKNVDKLLGLGNINSTNIHLKRSKTFDISNGNSISANNNSENSVLSKSPLNCSMPSLSQDTSEKVSVGKKSNSSNSKGAKELLQNLSEILSNENRSDKQNAEGHNLLNALAGMLHEASTSNTNNSEDSGHSSIPDEHADLNYCELPNISGNTNSINTTPLMKNISLDNQDISDQELKSKTVRDLNRRLSHSFSFPSSKAIPSRSNSSLRKSSGSSFDLSHNKSQISNGSVSSNDRKNVSNENGIGKVNKIQCRRLTSISSASRRGPLKATLPISNMARQKIIHKTPTKADQKIPIYQSKRTSTPIHEPKIKPMAQSTPETHSTLKDNKKFGDANGHAQTSPVSKPTTYKVLSCSETEKLDSSHCSSNGSYKRNSDCNISGSPVNVRPTKGIAARRYSASEIKKPANKESKLQRSNSMSKDKGIMSTLSKVRQNITSSSYYQPKTLRDSSNISSRNTSSNCSSMSGNGSKSMKNFVKTGKENAGH